MIHIIKGIDGRFFLMRETDRGLAPMFVEGEIPSFRHHSQATRWLGWS